MQPRLPPIHSYVTAVLSCEHRNSIYISTQSFHSSALYTYAYCEKGKEKKTLHLVKRPLQVNPSLPMKICQRCWKRFTT